MNRLHRLNLVIRIHARYIAKAHSAVGLIAVHLVVVVLKLAHIVSLAMQQTVEIPVLITIGRCILVTQSHNHAIHKDAQLIAQDTGLIGRAAVHRAGVVIELDVMLSLKMQHMEALPARTIMAKLTHNNVIQIHVL